MLEKIDKIQELLNVPNADADTETAIANMKILNLLVDLRAETEQLILSGVVKSLPVNRGTALKVREDIINKHYKDDPNKNTFGLDFITCYDWLAKICNK